MKLFTLLKKLTDKSHREFPPEVLEKIRLEAEEAERQVQLIKCTRKARRMFRGKLEEEVRKAGLNAVAKYRMEN